MKGGAGSVSAVSGGKIARVMRRTEDADAQSANARLIAAAPDLLAALERIITEATGHTLVSLVQARAAITRARGGK
jgi:hypothetical protein